MMRHASRGVSLAISAASHVLLVAGVIALAPQRQPASPQTKKDITVTIATIPMSREPAASEAIAEAQKAAGVPVGPEPLPLAGLEIDIARVRSRQGALFPFLTDSLTALDEARAAAERLGAALVWRPRSAPARRASALPPLAITSARLTRLVDNAWSRRERWGNFIAIATLVTRHDPDEGRAPEVLRSYLARNLLQPYYETTTRDPLLWVMLGLAADHAPVLRFVDGFIRKYPSSRSSTELLFLLDELADASRDALLTLMATQPDRDLHRTRAADPEAYALAVTIRERYSRWLPSGQFESTLAIRRHYDAVRLRILMTIVETTPGGYGVSDARFLIGRILWDRNSFADAMRWWREMRPDGRGAYAEASTRILQELHSPTASTPERISAILGAEHGRWLESSRRRLAQFGYAVDTF